MGAAGDLLGDRSDRCPRRVESPLDKCLPFLPLERLGEVVKGITLLRHVPVLLKKGPAGPRLETRLLRMLVNARHCAATDPRDKLYGILLLLAWDVQQAQETSVNTGLSDFPNEELDLIVKPSYALSPSQVFTDLTARLMQYFGLDILQEVSSPPSVNDLPSWVPDWTIDVPQNGELQSYLDQIISRLETENDSYLVTWFSQWI